MVRSDVFRGSRIFIALLVSLVLSLAAGQAGAAAKLVISKAAWSKNQLKIKGKLKGGATAAPIELFDINGRWLKSFTGPGFQFTAGKDELPTVPCAVRVQSGDAETIKPVNGAPKSCAKAPTCKITAPVAGTAIMVKQDVVFSAEAATKDKTAALTKYEWDFAGGSMGELIPGSSPSAFKRPDGLSATVQFVRDNSRYRVRFVATDAKGRRCEDAVEVVVGTPPTGLPAKVAEQAAPGFGAEGDGTQSDVVVLPFEEWSYQNLSDMRLLNNAWSSASPVVNNVRAYAFRKDRLPVFLGPGEVELRYSAASNASDPAGKDSINSTSRNWPTTAAMVDAALKKSDWWDIPTTDGEAIEKKSSYQSCPWMMSAYGAYWSCGGYPSLDFITADEGYFRIKLDETTGAIVPNDPNTDLGHGAYMPGRDNPYVANTPQPFSRYDTEHLQFEAQLLPYTDIDDQGRVNPYPLIRVEAVAKGGNSVAAKTDGTVSISHDFHCRECHAKGKLAANPNAPHTSAAYLSTPSAKPCRSALGPGDPLLDKPQFFEPASDEIFEQEYAAALNYSSLHEFYDGMHFISRMVKGDIEGVNAGGHCGHHDPNDPDHGKLNYNSPRQCYGCHETMLRVAPFNPGDHWGSEDEDITSDFYDPNYSISMHRFHAELQWNADKTDILRNEKGAFVRWDYRTKGSNNSTKTGSLFPIFDDQGQQLPMEQNCLRCHAGHREQLYRDRMFTAGVTCYDCHGDMMAVGQTFPKKGHDGKGADGKRDSNEYRVPWFDEPDCGSCHTGDGNENGGGFFNAGVLKTAFAPDDPSAMPLQPKRERFAVVPAYQRDFEWAWYGDEAGGTKILKVKANLFREGKDTHGNVACAACHGAAHSIWPNRDPSANDNVTALQLQGHAGHILECNVCHTADSFKELKDLDGGRFMTDLADRTDFHGGSGILGGPHNMHPVNDPNWWKKATGNTDVADDTGNSGDYGGWHNDIAKRPGKNGEDQCAACHGSDHKGTRLSKTPVDRVFDFSKGFNFAKLKKAGFKKKVIKVAAGTQIGCDTCHSLDTSFLK